MPAVTREAEGEWLAEAAQVLLLLACSLVPCSHREFNPLLQFGCQAEGPVALRRKRCGALVNASVHHVCVGARFLVHRHSTPCARVALP